MYKIISKAIWQENFRLGMSDFLKILNHSCEKLGSHLVQVDRFYASSQLCNNCGYKNPLLKDVRIREWTCPVCGVHHDRDINAGINIDKEGNRLFSKLKSKQKTE
jgi:putative transposase